MTLEIYRALAELENTGESAALCIIVHTQGSTPRHVGSKMLVYADGRVLGTIGGGELESRVIQEALSALQEGKPRRLQYRMADPEQGDPGVCGGQLEVYVEPISPRPTLLVVGAGHVGQAVSHLGHWLGFQVVVSDDRPEFCTPEVVPEAEEFHPVPLEELPRHFRITPQTYLVLTTRGVTIDVPGLPALLETSAVYIGVIGSRRRWETTRRELQAAGVPEEKLERVVSPIGLDIAAETPEEIAVSILAQIIQLRRGGGHSGA